MNQNTGIASMTVNQMVDQLSNAYISIIQAGVALKNFPSVMLWGPPGVGKSQGIRQMADIIAEKTHKRVVITDVRLLLFNPVDLRGIPTANADKTLAVWLRPKIFQMDESSEVINILFLDEISAAPQSVQAAAYQITLDRTIGEHRLPENCIVIAAGNRVTDRSVAYTMPKALANRMCHIEIDGDSYSWRKWAVSSGINPLIIGFMDYRPQQLMDFDSQSNGLAFPTPRSWEMVSNILNNVSDDIKRVLPLIIGCVGEAAAYELLSWGEINEKIPNVEEIFSGKTVGVPTRPEVVYALTASIDCYARSHHSSEEIDNLVSYVLRLPTEFKDRIFYDLIQIKSMRKGLYKNRNYFDWFMRKGLDWEDYGL